MYTLLRVYMCTHSTFPRFCHFISPPCTAYSYRIYCKLYSVQGSCSYQSHLLLMALVPTWSVQCLFTLHLLGPLYDPPTAHLRTRPCNYHFFLNIDPPNCTQWAESSPVCPFLLDAVCSVQSSLPFSTGPSGQCPVQSAFFLLDPVGSVRSSLPFSTGSSVQCPVQSAFFLLDPVGSVQSSLPFSKDPVCSV